MYGEFKMNFETKKILVVFSVGVILGVCLMKLCAKPNKITNEITIQQTTTNLEVRNVYIVV